MVKYENQLDIFIIFHDQVCKKIYSTYRTELDFQDESNDFGIKKFFDDLKIEELRPYNPMNLSFVLSKILCENHSRRLISPLKASILIINDNIHIPNSQYVQIMNSIFESQRNEIKINVLDLFNNASSGNVLLQQAASITYGNYIKIKSVSEIVPSLFTFSQEISSSSSKNILSSFKQESVDFRGSCFCHGKVVDFGYVCSVCLSGKETFTCPNY